MRLLQRQTGCYTRLTALMKTPRDPRHIGRQNIVKSLFAQSFIPQETSNEKVQIILGHKDAIDSYIEKIAPEFPIDKLNRVDLAILRLGVYELMIDKQQPPKVIVDESIELAKEFGGETSPAFINGALGKLLKEFVNNELS